VVVTCSQKWVWSSVVVFESLELGCRSAKNEASGRWNDVSASPHRVGAASPLALGVAPVGSADAPQVRPPTVPEVVSQLRDRARCESTKDSLMRLAGAHCNMPGYRSASASLMRMADTRSDMEVRADRCQL